MIMTKKTWLLIVISLAVALIFVFSSYLFFTDYRKLYKNGSFENRPMHLFRAGGSAYSRSSGIGDVSLIRSWMTISYLNQTFNLPRDYLGTMLQINNSRYPNVSIQSIAREKNVSVSEFILKVERAVGDYLSAESR